jgi:peptidoglycan hydrolase-like protein with peptidoglycan-binding domain
MGRGAAAAVDEDDVGRGAGILRQLGWSHRDAVGVIVGAVASLTILINMLFLQPGPHRAPMVKSGVIAAAAPGPELAGTGTSPPQPRVIDTAQPKPNLVKAAPIPAAPAPTASRVRPLAEVIADIQRELSRRGYYDGVVDGRYGPRTDTAIRDFEQAAGLRATGQPNEDLLRAIARSPAKARPSPAPPPAARKQSAPPAKQDPIAEMLTPSTRVTAVQRALSEFGYGQINPTGIVDSDTQRAIERFERERRLPVTGQLSHRVVRELGSITGRPLE